ncbi:LOW QUALITY PROTEIN: N-succinyl arginine/lysine racemase [Bacillus sp. JCM 19045]|nr:LOW QUALITY PROTEIN: N-succinyl arginine/lysine racemase [Bacillus sp. JCM 19045]
MIDTVFNFRILNEQDLSQLLSLQNYVYETLTNRATLATLSKTEYTPLLNGKGLCIGALKAMSLAHGLCSFHQMDDNHLGIDAGLEKQELSKVIYQEISLVHPLFRGWRLQQQMGERLMDLLVNADGKYRYVCATVAPGNIASLKDKLKQNMEIVALKKKYNGNWRYVFFKDLNQNKVNQVFDDQQWLPSDNLSEQESLLRKGYQGVEIQIENEESKLLFVKETKPKNK